MNSNQHNYEFDQVQVDFDRGQEQMVAYLLDQKQYTGLGYIGGIYDGANGRIGATTVTNHSIGMITEDGLRVFIHVGLGTVEMNGKGFARFVEMGDVVKAGQPLISFDREAIKAAGHEDIVTVIVSELDRLKSIDHVGESGTLIGGNPLVKLGDPLLVAKTK